ncbi:DUF3558 domain-containing protein [Actinopolyspora mortivallis]|uniref:DUF3558 domain-containing protein n=1 Tax=Actinopolyspora mortivallis TaxID=33906 RepID=UPI0012EDA0E3|nr:DUF3558 domain-containing protein [Actinopolyspora mortivallis]
MSMASWFRRGGVVAGGVVVSVLLAACSAGSPAEPPSASGGPTTESSTSSDPSGVEIADPKDAMAVDECQLLTAEAAQKVGVRAQGEKKKENLTLPDEDPKTCIWESASGSTSIFLTVLSDRSIQQYYDNPDYFVDFKKLRIAGYPAVRANQDDPMTGGSCDVFLASKRNQVVKSTSFLPSDEVGTVDPCELSKQALELSVSSWPDAE